jgi:hypothetical protein
MFKPGDRVICINNISTYGNSTEPLNMYHTYIVKQVIPINNHRGKFISIVPEGYLGMGFNEKRFVNLLEFRKLKIDKICSKLEKK